MQIKLTLEYEGTAYHGWQVQPNGLVTVQGVLEAAAAQMLGHPVRMVAAGRTDTGVHAAAQVVCFRTERRLDPAVAQRALNALTPDDIAVHRAEVVDDGFHPRYGARGRSYVYRICNRRVPSVFWRRYAWHVPLPLDREAMARAAPALAGEHDFSSFQAAGCQAKNPVRVVRRSELSEEDGLLVYTVEATAFLRHMVRNIVGTLVEVGRGERAAESMEDLLRARDRTRAGATAPAHGLCLLNVSYAEAGR